MRVPQVPALHGMTPLGLELPSKATDQKTIAERQWRNPKLAPKPQQACDVGLFSDQHKQIDLIDTLTRKDTTMKPKGACYTVVENAGYEGEQEVRTAFSTSEAAWRWAERHYSRGELESLHVQVRRDSFGERTYEY